MDRTSLPAPSERDTVSGAYVLELVRLVSGWQVPAADLLAGTSLSELELEEPAARVPLATMCALIRRARVLTGEPGLGVCLGMRKRISMYGYLGFAMMSAATVGECLELAARFTPILTSALTLRLDVGGGVASLAIEWQVDLGDAEDFASLSIVVGLTRLGIALTGRDLAGAAELEMPEPTYYRRFQHVLPAARFGQGVTRVVFDAGLLDVALATADRAALRLARGECERALAALDFDPDIGARVRRALRAGSGIRGLNEIAALLGLSARTLSRRLAEQGLSFFELVDRERHDRALALLADRRVSLAQVTERLGYSTVPNFVRAFRRWTGMTPGAHRLLYHGGTSTSGPATP